ncbi:MAG: 2-oxoacid:acceptor oxidoreductase family protein [Candidatus Aenigmarchaeota archaeon]|nr:2-oxoacid:acceptor oxidoreductase family protein [Candidatus Aenigmarchaeota archaeon]
MLVVKIVGLDAGPLAKIVAKAGYLSGLFVQSFCLQNKGYVKLDKKPLLSKQEEFPDFLLLMDSQNIQEALKHAKEKSVVILNTPEKPKSPAIKKRKLKVYSLNATALALSVIRKPEPGVIMLGALVKHCDKITAKSAKLAVGERKELHLALDEGFRNVK